MQPKYGWKRGSLPSDPKETVSEGWAWTGLGGQEVCSWCILFQEHFLSIAISPSHHSSIWITQCRKEEIKQSAYQFEVVSDK